MQISNELYTGPRSAVERIFDKEIGSFAPHIKNYAQNPTKYYLYFGDILTIIYLGIQSGYRIQKDRNDSHMDSYMIRKNSATCFTVIVTSPRNQSWKPLESNGLAVRDEHCIPHGASQEYLWTVEVEEPGTYELRMIRQSCDGAFRKVIIPIIADTA